MSALKMQLKKGDTVIVISGKEKGKKGKILHTSPETNRITIEGVNIVKRHTRPTQKVMQGGIIEKEAPIHASNVMLVCPKCSQPVKIGYKVENGVKKRVCKKCSADVG